MGIEINDSYLSLGKFMHRHKTGIRRRMIAAENKGLISFFEYLQYLRCHILLGFQIIIVANIIRISKVLQVDLVIIYQAVSIHIEQEAIFHPVHDSSHHLSYAVRRISRSRPSSACLCIIV